MITKRIPALIIYGDKKDTQIKDCLLKLLSDKFNINYISEGTVSALFEINSSFCERMDINIIEMSSLNNINIKNAILILKNNAKINSIKFVDNSVNIIINADNTKNLLKLTKTINNIYTCGFSSKDYATFSSRESNNAVISLQRSIRLENDRVLDPMEIPCVLQHDINDYSILASVLAMIMLGITEEKILEL